MIMEIDISQTRGQKGANPPPPQKMLSLYGRGSCKDLDNIKVEALQRFLGRGVIVCLGI